MLGLGRKNKDDKEVTPQKLEDSAAYSINSLSAQFDYAAKAETETHERQTELLGYYLHSVLAESKAINLDNDSLAYNLLKSVCDKNTYNLSGVPTIKVPIPADQEMQEVAARNERILMGTLQGCDWENEVAEMAFNGSVKEVGYFKVYWDMKLKRPVLKSVLPDYSYPVYSSEENKQLLKFFYSYNVDVETIRMQYPEVEADAVPITSSLNGRDYVRVVEMWDKEVKAVWFHDAPQSDKTPRSSIWLEKPHKHEYPFGIPYIAVRPLPIPGKKDGQSIHGALLGMQAELNDTMRRSSKVIDKWSDPMLVIKGFAGRDIKKEVSTKGGGILALKQAGEAMYLQPADNPLAKEYIEFLKQGIKDISGFSTASFGESVGANTSGDALNLYFSPTTKMSEYQWKQYSVAYRTACQMILQLWETFGKGQQNEVVGKYPHAQVYTSGGKQVVKSGYFEDTFDGEEIKGYYRVEIVEPDFTVKDKLAAQRMTLDAWREGMIPLTKALEDYGDTDPQQTMEQLRQENADMALRPKNLQGTAAMTSAMTGLQPEPEIDPVTGQPIDPMAAGMPEQGIDPNLQALEGLTNGLAQ